MVESMRTFVTDRQTDGLTDGAGFIGPRCAGPKKSSEIVKKQARTYENLRGIAMN